MTQLIAEAEYVWVHREYLEARYALPKELLPNIAVVGALAAKAGE